MIRKQKISVVTGCYNEVENIPLFYERLLDVLEHFPNYTYEIIVADNFSTDGTREILRQIAATDPNFKVILNSNNFGTIRSPYNALLHATGDVVFYLCSDLQEPPEMLDEFMAKYQEGYQVVCGICPPKHETPIHFVLHKIYYSLLESFTRNKQIRNFSGFGLYSSQVIAALRHYPECYPHFPGLIAEIGFKRAEVNYVQAKRSHGRTKGNFFIHYDRNVNKFINHTKLPLRLAVLTGFTLGAISLAAALFFTIMKIVLWEEYDLGMAPLIIGLCFFAAVQLLVTGIIGEYIGAIWTQVQKKPLAIEEELINFDQNKKFDL